jgi:hypothetical protein
MFFLAAKGDIGILIFFFEDVPARDRHPDRVYLEEVKKCDV